MAKKALCVGVNDYGQREGAGMPNMNLVGCVNDAHDWANLLVRHFDFSVADITLLIDADATRATILKGIKDLMAFARKGDVLVLTNSSHGWFTPDVSGDEEEREFDVMGQHFKGKFDQAICPYDYPKLIIDDEFHELFSGLPDGVNLTFLDDSCFSGDLTDYSEDEKKTTDSGSSRHHRHRRRYRRSLHPELVFLSGGSATRMVGDMPADESKGRHANGFMTYNAIQTITEAVNNGQQLTYRELHEKLMDRIKNSEIEKYRDQDPQLETSEQNKDLYIFTTKFKKTSKHGGQA